MAMSAQAVPQGSVCAFFTFGEVILTFNALKDWFTKHGFGSYARYDLNDSYDDQHVSEMFIAHREYSDGAHFYARLTEYISGKPETSFYNANNTIQHISSSKDALYTYNSQQYHQAQDRFVAIMWVIMIIYPVEIAVTIIIYRRKSKVTQK